MKRLPLSPRTLVAMVAAAIVGSLLVWFYAPGTERSADPIPDPLEPYLLVKRSDVVFRWAIPSDGSPVYVEVLQAEEEVSRAGEPALRRIWISETVRRGLLRLPGDAPVPDGPLYWRPVAVPETGEPRPGTTMTFEIYW